MKRILAIAFVFFAILLFCVDCAAAEFPDEINGFVPDGAKTLLPDGVPDGGFSAQQIDIGFFASMILRAITSAAPDAAKNLSVMLGLLIISSVLGALRGGISSKGLSEALEFISVLCVCGAAFSMTAAVFDTAERFITDVGAFLEGFLPILAGLSAASGNVAFSIASSVSVSAALSAVSAVCASVAMPLLKICFCISISGAVCGSVDLSGISGAIKKLITVVLSLSGIALSAVMIFQRVITKSADSAALRGIKFSVGTLIPFVGNAIGEALTTVTGGVGMIRSAVGISGAVVLCAMAIIPVASLLINKLFLDLASGAAGMLGLSKEKNFISGMSGVVGFLCAITAFIGVFFILSVSLIAGTEVSV